MNVEIMGQVCRRVAQALMAALSAQGFNLAMNNFGARGRRCSTPTSTSSPLSHRRLKLFPQASYKPGDMEKPESNSAGPWKG